MMWKHILIQMTQLSLNGTPPDANRIIDRAVLRLHKRVLALQYEITCMFCKSEARGQEPSLSNMRRRILGLGEINDRGRIILNPELVVLIDLANVAK